MLENNEVKCFKIGNTMFNSKSLKIIDSKNYLFESLKSDKEFERLSKTKDSMSFAKSVVSQLLSFLISDLSKNNIGRYTFTKVSRNNEDESILDSKEYRELIITFLKSISPSDLSCHQWMGKYGGLKTCLVLKSEKIIPRISIYTGLGKGLHVTDGELKIYVPIDNDSYIYINLRHWLNNWNLDFNKVIAGFAAQYLLMYASQIKL